MRFRSLEFGLDLEYDSIDDAMSMIVQMITVPVFMIVQMMLVI